MSGLYCSICPHVPGRDRVPPSGPSPCRILFLAERPSREEDRSGTPLADRGKTGIEFNDSYLPLAALYRENVAVYNAVCCSDKGYNNPTPEQAAACSSHHLPALLRRLQPEIIVTMGAVSASLFPNISLSLHRGIPQWSSYGDWSGIVFPTFHPSAGLHSTAYMIPLRQDFEALKHLLRDLDNGTFEWPSDPYPTPDYQVLRTVHDLSDYLRGSSEWTYGRNVGEGRFYEFGTDTEFITSTSPLCLTFSHTPGTGRLIYASSPTVLSAFFSYLRHFRPLLTFHNYLADVDPYRILGHPIDPRRFSDTMVRAYNLGIGGGGDSDDSGSARGDLGLKTLAYRHLSMTMKSFDDLVTPHALPLIHDYLTSVIDLVGAGFTKDPVPTCICGHPQSLHSPRGKSGRLTGPCQHDLTTPTFINVCPCPKFTRRRLPTPDRATSFFLKKLTTLLSETTQSLLSPTNSPAKLTKKKWSPWSRIEEWHPWEKDLMTTMIGPVPEKSILLVPESELIPYACGDADATLRLSRYLNTYRP
jgi:uracil-DNA glycosylase family 4